MPDGPHKRELVSCSKISLWLITIIITSHVLKDRVPPFLASWTFQHKISVIPLCKAANWSSFHTLSKFYQVDVVASNYSILQASYLRRRLPPVLLFFMWTC